MYNSAPSAPAVWKNVRGDILFQNGGASLCFSQATPDATLVRYVERLLNQQGANKVTRGPEPCELFNVGSSTDIIAFQRGELLKQPESYIGALVRIVEDDTFREYRIVTDYLSTVQKLEARSLQLETEVDKNAREGYGVLAIGESATVCIITPEQAEKVDGIKALLSRDKDLISPKLTDAWRFVATTADLAYLGVQRQQCGYVSGDANVLRPVMVALRREQKKYQLSPVWFTPEDVSRATFDARDEREQQLRKEQERLRKLKEDTEIARVRKEKNESQKSEIEARLRQQHGVRARSLKDGIHGIVKELAERRPTEGERRFPSYINWLRGRFADQWETFEVTTEIDDFGSVTWKGRLLDGIIVKTGVQQKNRIRGEYSRDCFVFGLVDDVEFSMLREMFGEACANSDQLVSNWKIANQFQSLWNAEQRGELGKPEVLALDAAKPQPPGNRLAAVDPDVPFDPPAAFKPEPPVLQQPGEIVATADPAIQTLDQTIATNPDDAIAHSKRGQLFVLRGNFPLAIKDFDEVLRLKPKDPEAFNNRCWANAVLGDLKAALPDCNEAVAIRPRYADAFDSRGFVNLKNGQPNEAVADYDSALRINPRQASSLYGRGMAKLKTGNSADAMRDIAAAKALQANIAEVFATFGIR